MSTTSLISAGMTMELRTIYCWARFDGPVNPLPYMEALFSDSEAEGNPLLAAPAFMIEFENELANVELDDEESSVKRPRSAELPMDVMLALELKNDDVEVRLFPDTEPVAEGTIPNSARSLSMAFGLELLVPFPLELVLSTGVVRWNCGNALKGLPNGTTRSAKRRFGESDGNASHLSPCV